MRQLIFPILLSSLLLVSCKQDIQNEDAVKKGIMNYLSKRQDLGSMDVSVTKVAFRQDEADATVHFQSKNTDAPGAALDLQYVLERKGNEWVVKGKAVGGGGHAGGAGGMDNPHGGGAPPSPGPLPPGHPTVPQSTPDSNPGKRTSLPPGHPPVQTPPPATK